MYKTGSSTIAGRYDYLPANAPVPVTLPAGTVLVHINTREGAQSFRTIVR